MALLFFLIFTFDLEEIARSLIPVDVYSGKGPLRAVKGFIARVSGCT